MSTQTITSPCEPRDANDTERDGQFAVWVIAPPADVDDEYPYVAIGGCVACGPTVLFYGSPQQLEQLAGNMLAAAKMLTIAKPPPGTTHRIKAAITTAVMPTGGMIHFPALSDN